jgi:hypothetical protein
MRAYVYIYHARAQPNFDIVASIVRPDVLLQAGPSNMHRAAN